MPNLQSVHFNLANVDISVEPPSDLPAVAKALSENKPFGDDAFADGAIRLGSIKAAASKDFALDGIRFGASGGLFSGLGVYRAAGGLIGDLKAQGLSDPVIDEISLPVTASNELYAIRWGYDASASVSGKIALGPGLEFGASGRTEGLYAVVRSLDRNLGSLDALGKTINSWKMPRQVRNPDSLEPGTCLIAETDGSLKLSLGVEYGYNYSWVRQAVALGGLSGDLGLKIDIGAKAALGFDMSGRYATVLYREDNSKTIRLKVFKMRQQGWSFAFDASISAQISQSDAPADFDEFIKGVFNLNGLQILKDIEKWLDPDTTLATMLGGELVDYAKKLFEQVTGFDPETEFDKGIGVLKGLIERWHQMPHEVTGLLYGFLAKGLPLDGLKDFLNRVIELSEPEALKDEILSHLQGVDFFDSVIGKWISAAAGQGILSFLENIDEERERFAAIARQTLGILDGSTLEETLKKLQDWFEEKLGLGPVLAVAGEADFQKLDAWLKKRLSDLLGRSAVLEDVQKIKDAINRLRSNADDFLKKGLKVLTDKYTAEFHASFQRSSAKNAFLDVTFDFDANAANAETQLKNALAGDFTSILTDEVSGVVLNKAVLTHEIKRNTHLEVKLPFFNAVRDHITESLATGEIVNAADGRLWIFNLKAVDTVKKKSSISKLSIAAELTKSPAVRQFDKTSFRYDYTLLLARRNATREYLEEKLDVLAGEYFASEFDAPGKQSFSVYLTALDKSLDDKGIKGDNVFGNLLTSLEVSLEGDVLGAWKNAPGQKLHPIYMAVSRRVQALLRRYIPLTYLQDLDQYEALPVIYPLLVYSALPPMNRVKLTSGGKLKFTEDDLYWDSTDEELRMAIFNQYCAPRLRDTILPQVRDALADRPHTRSGYETGEIGKMLSLSPEISMVDFNGLVFQEREIISGIVGSGRQFRKFLDETDIEKAIGELARFGEKISDAFNENITSIYKGSALRPLGTLLMLAVADVLDPGITAKPSALLDLYILDPGTTFKVESFLTGAKPEGDQIAVHQSILNVE